MKKLALLLALSAPLCAFSSDATSTQETVLRSLLPDGGASIEAGDLHRLYVELRNLGNTNVCPSLLSLARGGSAETVRSAHSTYASLALGDSTLLADLNRAMGNGWAGTNATSRPVYERLSMELHIRSLGGHKVPPDIIANVRAFLRSRAAIESADPIALDKLLVATDPEWTRSEDRKCFADRIVDDSETPVSVSDRFWAIRQSFFPLRALQSRPGGFEAQLTNLVAAAKANPFGFRCGNSAGGESFADFSVREKLTASQSTRVLCGVVQKFVADGDSGAAEVVLTQLERIDADAAFEQCERLVRAGKASPNVNRTFVRLAKQSPQRMDRILRYIQEMENSHDASGVRMRELFSSPPVPPSAPPSAD